MRDTTDLAIVGQIQHRNRVHERNDETTVSFIAHNHVARQQKTDIGFCI